MVERNAEARRLSEEKAGTHRWSTWGPYVSERQWGTVREDCSPYGTAWDAFSHDVARSRAYRWGEDGIAGVSDELQRLNVTLALWNGQDPILKERLYGLTNSEGNHGEDVKELYWYLDAAPSHAYLKMLYKYPQRAFPYTDLVQENRRRGMHELEYELLDTGLFDEDWYFDVFVEYARGGVEDWCMQITVENRGPDVAPIWVIPQLVFRNTWSWGREPRRPRITSIDGGLTLDHPELGRLHAFVDQGAELLFTENETNPHRAFGLAPVPGYFKDAFHRHLVDGERGAVSPHGEGTKAGVVHLLEIPAGGRRQVRLRWSREPQPRAFEDFAAVMSARRDETEAFYAEIQRGISDEDARRVQRQAFAGMIWSKQLFYFDVTDWLDGDPGQPPPPPERRFGRNADWRHLNNADVISMPDKWEYPWYAAWDLAFHCIPLAMVDPEFAKGQLKLMTREWYMHPNGQLPAYEWAFQDVNPPVHAWATWRVYNIDATSSKADSSGSTISGFLTAPRPFQPGFTSTSPMGRAGWRCTASISCGSRSSWRSITRFTRISRASSSSTSCTSQKR